MLRSFWMYMEELSPTVMCAVRTIEEKWNLKNIWWMYMELLSCKQDLQLAEKVTLFCSFWNYIMIIIVIIILLTWYVFSRFTSLKIIMDILIIVILLSLLSSQKSQGGTVPPLFEPWNQHHSFRNFVLPQKYIKKICCSSKIVDFIAFSPKISRWASINFVISRKIYTVFSPPPPFSEAGHAPESS